MAQCQLPFSFHILAGIRLVKPSPAGGKRNRRNMEESDGIPSVVDQRNVRPRIAAPSQRGPPGNEWINLPKPRTNPWGTTQGGLHHGATSLPQISPPQLSRSANTITSPLNAVKLPNQAVTPPRKDVETVPILVEVNPASGSIAGDAKIWLKGTDFSDRFALYARFGSTVVPTVGLLSYP